MCNEMAYHTTSRRSVLRTLAAGALGAVVAGSGTATAQEASLEEQLATVQEATARYRSPAAAIEDGFQPTGPYVPGMGWHFIHQSRVRTAAAEGPTPEEVPALTYLDTGDHLILGAAEYTIPVPNDPGYTEADPPDLFADGASDGGSRNDDGHDHDHGGGGDHEQWHTHHAARHVFAMGDGERADPSAIALSELLTPGRWAEVPTGRDVEPGDEVTADFGLDGSAEPRVVDLAPPAHPDLLTLHAWVHAENPLGVFAPVNPATRYVEMLPDDLLARHRSETAEPVPSSGDG